MINAPTTLVIAIFAGIAIFAVVGWLLAMKTARKEIELNRKLFRLNRTLMRLLPPDRAEFHAEDGLDV